MTRHPLALAVATLVAAAVPAGAAPAGAAEPGSAAARSAFERLSETDRLALQDALVWTGDLDAAPTGSFGPRTVAAIEAWQRRAGRPVDGSLDLRETAAVLAAGARARAEAGFAPVLDGPSGVRIDVPARLLPKRSRTPAGATRLQSEDERVTLDIRALPGGEAELKAVYDRAVAPAPGRVYTTRLLRPDLAIVAGETATGRFHTRYAAGPGGLRGFSLAYDKALGPQWDRIAVAIGAGFVPFPGAAPSSNIAATPPAGPAPLARPAEPAPTAAATFTGLAVAPRRIVTALPPGGCRDPAVDGARARLVRSDGGIAVLEPSADHRVVPVRLADPAGPGPERGRGAVAFLGREDGPVRPVVAPADILGPDRLRAPLQDGAAGSPVVDADGAVVGIVAPLAGTRRSVAGLLPPLAHAMLGTGPVRAALGPDAPAPGGPAVSAASLAPALASVTCGPER